MASFCSPASLPARPPVRERSAPGRYVYASATWLLVVADALAYFNPAAPWVPPAAPKVTALQLKYICPLQMAGASLLFVGSVIYVAWALAGKAPRGGASDLARTLLAPADEAPLDEAA